jgi:hypothetical protein
MPHAPSHLGDQARRFRLGQQSSGKAGPRFLDLRAQRTFF